MKYLTPRAAAESLGYTPQSESPRDPQLRAFRALADRHFPEAKRWIGARLMFDPVAIESKVRQPRDAGPVVDSSLGEMQALAVAHAHGRNLDMRRRRAGYPRAVMGWRS